MTQAARLARAMFDLQRHRSFIADHYYRILRDYRKPHELRQFCERWIDLLEIYSKQPNFVTFEPPVPILHRLVPKAVAVLVVPFSNTKIPPRLRRVSVFPLFPFKIQYKDNACCSREGLELLQLYLHLTGIRRIGFLKVGTIPAELIESQDLEIYGPHSFTSFRRVCQREALM